MSSSDGAGPAMQTTTLKKLLLISVRPPERNHGEAGTRVDRARLRGPGSHMNRHICKTAPVTLTTQVKAQTF